MTQELRNKIYAVAASLGLIAVTLGLITPDGSETALGLVDQTLTLIGSVITLGSTILAFVKSLTSKVTVVEVPKARVNSVNTTGGGVVAVD